MGKFLQNLVRRNKSESSGMRPLNVGIFAPKTEQGPALSLHLDDPKPAEPQAGPPPSAPPVPGLEAQGKKPSHTPQPVAPKQPNTVDRDTNRRTTRIESNQENSSTQSGTLNEPAFPPPPQQKPAHKPYSSKAFAVSSPFGKPNASLKADSPPPRLAGEPKAHLSDDSNPANGADDSSPNRSADLDTLLGELMTKLKAELPDESTQPASPTILNAPAPQVASAPPTAVRRDAPNNSQQSRQSKLRPSSAELPQAQPQALAPQRIEISIGSIELVAEAPKANPTPPAAARRPRPRPNMSLQDYMKRKANNRL